jgi:predicted ArsR family transcriptional regulator
VTSKTEILSLLRREALTVAELCERLGVTRNAVNVHIKQLEAEGLARQSARRQQGGVGKPPVTYEAAPGSEDTNSKAYKTFLLGLLRVLGTEKRTGNLVELLDKTGRQLAKDAGLSNPKDFESGLRAAMKAADSLGASTEAIPQPDGVMVRNYSCPLGGAVRSESCVCQALASFFSEATGKPATAECLRDERLICQYRIKT